MGEIREPIKKTSIEKKHRIIEKGFELMCNEGYHNVSTIDIAKFAGVSTGIIYQYFKDKREIFLEGVKDYSNKIIFPMLDIIENKKIQKSDMKDIISKMIDNFIKKHTMTKKAHNELMAMSHLDEDVAQIFNKCEIEMTEKIAIILENNGIRIKNAKEKIHIVFGIIDNFCHEIVYHKHKELDYEIMKENATEIVFNVINN